MLPVPGKASAVSTHEKVTSDIPPLIEPPALFQIMQLVTVGEARSAAYTPPQSFAQFPAMVQLTNVGDASDEQYTPPPRPTATFSKVYSW